MKATSAAPSTSAPVAHNALPPPSATSNARSSRIAPHSHITGLGLTSDGLAAPDGAGFIGQTNAREVVIMLLYFSPRIDQVRRHVVWWWIS
jgi:RuvB-like protein 1 (pontin 52)